jgi:hypothetical protein
MDAGGRSSADDAKAALPGSGAVHAGGRSPADDAEPAAVSSHGLVAAPPLNPDAAGARLAEGTGMVRRRGEPGHPMTGRRRPAGDAANAVPGCSDPDDPEARSAGHSADELPTDKSRTDQRSRKSLASGRGVAKVVDPEAEGSGFRTRVDGSTR